MDYSSSYTQQNDQQFQQQQEENHQQQESYDLSQYQYQQQQQSYDHQQASNQPYYSSYPNNLQYPYYNSSQDYSYSYSHHQFHQEPTSIHPPGVPIPPPGTEQNRPHNQHYPQPVAESFPGSGSGPGFGLDPSAVAESAVAAISQLTQLPGNVDAAQTALQVPIGHTPFRGGRRGNRPFRGGRGHFGRHGPRPDGSAPSFRGRGRGQGGGGHFGSHGAVLNNPNSASAPAEGEAAFVQQQPSVSVPVQAPLPLPTQVPAAPFWRPPPRMAWCELCRVDCNTPEILEKHKNGKRHKKNLQVFEELQKLNKVTTGQQNEQMPNAKLKTDVGQPEKVEVNQPLSENTSQVTTNDNSNETEQQCAVAGDNSTAPSEAGRKQPDQIPARGRGSKRKMRGSRGGKYMRGNEGSRRPVEPPKPKQVIPLICELCNVKCESQVVFDSHLTGKKHQSNLKRFHGHRALYGEAGLQALYPPNFNAPSTSLAPQVQQGLNDPQVLLAQLLMTYVLSHAQAQGTVGVAQAPGMVGITQAPETVGAVPAPGSSSGTQNQPDSETQGTNLTLEDASQNGPSNTDTENKTENETVDVAAKDALVPIGNAVTVQVETLGVSEHVSGTVSDKALSSNPKQQEPENEETTQ